MIEQYQNLYAWYEIFPFQLIRIIDTYLHCDVICHTQGCWIFACIYQYPWKGWWGLGLMSCFPLFFIYICFWKRNNLVEYMAWSRMYCCIYFHIWLNVSEFWEKQKQNKNKQKTKLNIRPLTHSVYLPVYLSAYFLSDIRGHYQHIIPYL